MSATNLTSLDQYKNNTFQWNTILGIIPRIVYYFGDSDINFYSLILFLECSPEITYKIRLLAHRYGHSPLYHLLNVLFETAPNIDHFVHTIFEWARCTNFLQQWIDQLILDKTFPRIFMSYVDLYIGKYA